MGDFAVTIKFLPRAEARDDYQAELTTFGNLLIACYSFVSTVTRANVTERNK